MDYMVIKDTITGKFLTITRPYYIGKIDEYVVGRDYDTPELVKPRSVGKTIRAWVKERKKECPIV